jgi:hypothetical protein
VEYHRKTVEMFLEAMGGELPGAIVTDDYVEM